MSGAKAEQQATPKPQGQVDVLSQELETYEKHRQQLLAEAAGKFVLIKGDAVIDTFDTRNDAIGAGYKQFGAVPFLTKEIVRFETPIDFSLNARVGT